VATPDAGHFFLIFNAALNYDSLNTERPPRHTQTAQAEAEEEQQ